MASQREDGLRVGVVLDRLRAPRWISESIAMVRALAGARISLVVTKDFQSHRPDLRASFHERWRSGAYEIFRRLDRRLFRGRPDAFEETDLAPLLAGCPATVLRVERRADGDHLDETGRDDLRRHDLDVVLDFGAPPLKTRSGAVARHGLWSYRFGATPWLAARPAAFREVVDGTQALFTALVADDGGGHPPRLLYESWSPVDRRSVRRTLNQSLPKLWRFPARALEDLLRRGPEAATPPPAVTDRPGPVAGLPAPPGSVEVAGAAVILAARYGRDRLRRLVRRERWRLTCGFGLDRLAPRPDRFLIPPPGRMWADPFPVADEDGYWIFFEEASLATQIGHVNVLRMDPSGGCDAPARVLESESHLSYPCVFRAGPSWHLVPESSAARSVQLFRAKRFPFEWERQEVLLDEVRAYDPTLVEIDRRWWMFANIAPEAGSSWDELHLFHADRPQGPWRAHPRNPVKSDARSARPAGHVFEHRGCFYRPGQDCAVGYGRAVVVHRIVKISPREYVEEEVARILPDRFPRLAGIHTLNHAGGLTMMDCIVREPRWRWPAAGSVRAVPLDRR